MGDWLSCWGLVGLSVIQPAHIRVDKLPSEFYQCLMPPSPNTCLISQPLSIPTHNTPTNNKQQHKQELLAIIGSSKGLVLMAPPSGNAEAKKTMAAMLSGIKPNTKVCALLLVIRLFLELGVLDCVCWQHVTEVCFLVGGSLVVRAGKWCKKLATHASNPMILSCDSILSMPTHSHIIPSLHFMPPASPMHAQCIVAESFGGNDEPVDTLMANLVGAGAEVRLCVCVSRRVCVLHVCAFLPKFVAFFV